MAQDTVRIRCKNTKKTINTATGSSLSDIYSAAGLSMDYGPVSAKVNNKVEGMHYRVYRSKDVEFLDRRSASGLRTYTRTLFMVLCKAVSDLYTDSQVKFVCPVSNGYYCNVNIGKMLTDDDCALIHRRMDELIASDLPIHRHELPTEDVRKIFASGGHDTKVSLLDSIDTLYTTYYNIGDYSDYYYGSLLTSTGQLSVYGLEPYYDGLLLRAPQADTPEQLGPVIRQDKMFEIFLEHHRWQDLLGLSTVGDLNNAVAGGNATGLIHLSEALQEKKLGRIADDIASRDTVRMVLIAGPSSSGKTTTCKRLSIQLLANGIKPIGISLDDYFVDREQTPRDATGDYDYEHLHALNTDLLQAQMKALFRGEEVELPRYNFQTGRSERSGRKLRLADNEVLIVEGIHALNPELTADIPAEQIYRVYASALTTILLDNHNYIPTTDNRLLRRIIRDYKYRGCDARKTIQRWPSVRRGENKWIFPYQENADAMFNTAMLFELAVIKTQAQPLLELVPETADEHSEAYRLRKFLGYFRSIPAAEVPTTSLLREFLGGSSFTY